MLDTIKLTLDKTMIAFIDKDKFQKETQNASRGYFTLVQNPTKSELQNGIYKPRLTLTNRFNTSGQRGLTLAIEFSAPKLLFGNNFDELTDNDFNAVIDKLEEVLKTMGVRVFHQLLLVAPISAIHYSKNIPLTDGITPHYLISKIKEANISLALDVNQTDYRNDGHSYKWHANSYEVAFYDKIKDLEAARKSDKRAVEKDNLLQLHLFEHLNKKRLEVFRMEVRLNSRQKMKQLFPTLSIETSLTFQSLFTASISQKVLLHYVSELEKQRPQILDYQTTTAKALLADIIINNPKLGTLKTLQLFGLKQAIDVVTLRELRAMFSKYKNRSWYRLIADAKRIQLPSVKSPFQPIKSSLTSFIPLKLVDFQEQRTDNQAMSETDGGADLQPKLDKPTPGYTLISPDEAIMTKATDYLRRVQELYAHGGTAFVPSGLGMLIAPDGRNFIFSAFGGIPLGQVYDMAPLNTKVSSLETSQVLNCGVTSAKFEGYTMLVHSGSPDSVRNLTNRAFDLARANGATLQGPIDMSIQYNTQDGRSAYVTGPVGYAAKVTELGQRMGLRLNIRQATVSNQTTITA